GSLSDNRAIAQESHDSAFFGATKMAVPCGQYISTAKKTTTSVHHDLLFNAGSRHFTSRRYKSCALLWFAFAHRPAVGRQLLARERCHLAGDPEDTILQRHQLGIGRKPRDTRCPRQVIDRRGQYHRAILIPCDQPAGNLNPGDRTLLLTPLTEHFSEVTRKRAWYSVITLPIATAAARRPGMSPRASRSLTAETCRLNGIAVLPVKPATSSGESPRFCSFFCTSRMR